MIGMNVMAILKNYSSALLRILIVAVLDVLYCIPLGAEAFRYLTRDDGLSYSRYYSVCEDSEGFVWLYSHHGVDRYDGNIVVHYDLPSSSPVIGNDEAYVRMVCCKDRLYISMKNGDIFTYDRLMDRFVLDRHVCGGSLLGFLPEEALFCMSDGLYRGTEDGYERVALDGTPVYDMIPYEDDSWFAATSDGLSYVERTAGGFETASLATDFSGSIERMMIVCGKIYIGTFSGLYIYNIGGHSLKRVDSVPDVSICGFARSGSRELIVASDGGGIYVLDASTGKLMRQYYETGRNRTGLLSNSVADMCLDHTGRIWAVSLDGVCFLDPDAVKMLWIGQPSEDNPRGYHVNRMLQDREGNLWLGSDEGLAVMRNGSSSLAEKISDDGLPHVVLSLAEDSAGNIWAGGYSMCVYTVHGVDGSLEQIPSYKDNGSYGAPSSFIYSILSDGDYIWMGGIEGRLARYDKSTDRYTYFDNLLVGDMIKYSADTLLAATVEGLSVIDREKGVVGTISSFGGVPLSGPVRNVFKARDGRIWMATDGSGLISYSLQTGEARQYTKADGLSSMSVNNVLEDRSGRIWTTTEDGLYWIDSMSGAVKNARSYLSVPECFFNDRAAICLQDGRLGFGTSSGVFFFTPEINPYRTPEACRIYFYDFDIIGAQDRVYLSAVKALHSDRNVVLPYRSRSFRISYSAIADYCGGGFSFSYRLGSHDEWNASPEDNTLIFNDIASGSHVLSVRVSDKFTGEVLAEKQVRFVIKSPWWASWWAVLMYAALAFLSGWMLLRYFRQKESEARFQDKMRLFIGLAHDIRTPLNLIKAPLSDMSASENLPHEFKERLGIASRNVDRISEMVSRLLSLQKTEASGGSEKLTPVEVRAYVEGRVAEFLPAARQKAISLTFEVEPDVPCFIMSDVARLDHIVQNLLSNAVKYTSDGSVSLRVACSQKEWNIAVSDTGHGIPRSEQGRIFNDFFRAENISSSGEGGFGIGLVVVRRFVHQMNGRITFSSEEGKGSVFTVILPMTVYHKAVPVTDVQVNADLDSADPVQAATLLLVEDDADFRGYLCKVLSDEYNVLTAENGQQALDKIHEMEPDVIVADVMMPVMRGDDFCRALKNSLETSHIPVILMSALDDKENIILGLESGANDYVVKPFDMSVLKLRIRNLIRSRNNLRKKLIEEGVSTPEENYPNILDKKFMDSILSIMESEIGNENFTVEELVSRVGMSRTALYNKVKALSGESPNTLLRIVRLNRAKTLLEQKGVSIAEVAYQVGFMDVKYFSACFKKRFGISPSKV